MVVVVVVLIVVIVAVAIAEAAATVKIWWHIGCRVWLLSRFGICRWTQNHWLVCTVLMLYSVVRMQFEYPAVPHHRVAFSSHSGPSWIHFGIILLGYIICFNNLPSVNLCSKKSHISLIAFCMCSWSTIHKHDIWLESIFRILHVYTVHFYCF